MKSCCDNSKNKDVNKKKGLNKWDVPETPQCFPESIWLFFVVSCGSMSKFYKIFLIESIIPATRSALCV